MVVVLFWGFVAILRVLSSVPLTCVPLTCPDSFGSGLGGPCPREFDPQVLSDEQSMETAVVFLPRLNAKRFARIFNNALSPNGSDIPQGQ